MFSKRANHLKQLYITKKRNKHCAVSTTVESNHLKYKKASPHTNNYIGIHHFGFRMKHNRRVINTFRLAFI